MSTKESKKELKERLYNTKPKKLSLTELSMLSSFIAEDAAKELPKGKGSAAARPKTEWNYFFSDVSTRLKGLELDVEVGAMKFASYLKTNLIYPSEELMKHEDKSLKKLVKAHLKEEAAKPKEEKSKAKAKAKAKASLDSDSDSDSSSEDEAPKTKTTTKAA